MDKVVSVSEAISDIPDGASIAVGGFGLCGIPSALIAQLLKHGARSLDIVSNNCGVDDWGLGVLLRSRQIRRMTASYIGENKEFARQYLEGELEVELVPQGTLAERLRAGGVGIPAFYTATGVGTMVSDGGLPIRYRSDGSVAIASSAKPKARFDSLGHEREYVLEQGIRTDFSLVRAKVGDRAGNLVFDQSAKNFNPLAAMAGNTSIAEVETLVEVGEIPENDVQLPGIFVDRVVPLTAEQAAEKRIEKLTERA